MLNGDCLELLGRVTLQELNPSFPTSETSREQLQDPDSLVVVICAPCMVQPKGVIVKDKRLQGIMCRHYGIQKSVHPNQLMQRGQRLTH